VTLTIFGSTVSYPSDSLASCFEVSCQKRKKNVESVVQVFTFLHLEIASEHFHCKTITQMSCYTYNITLKLFHFIFG